MQNPKVESVFCENVIVITGASMGIGREIALKLAAQGAWLALASRNTEKLEMVSRECCQRGGKSICIPTDVADQSQCRNLIKATINKYGRIDTLINNAGIGHAASFVGLDDFTIYEQVIRVNFWGSVYCTFYALPYLKQSKSRIVGISSYRGKLPSANADAYGVSKYALTGFYDSLRLELAGSGISLTVIYPGWVKTGISSRAVNNNGTTSGITSHYETNAMPVERCAQIIINAAARRKREVNMTLEGKLALWLRLIFPGIIDLILRKKTD